ncbi:MAG: ACT domain-containing protein, partial [Planctomycetota bacterium]
ACAPRATIAAMTAPTFDFAVHPERLAICRLPATAAVPAWAQGGFVTVARTALELSVVCAQRHVPADVQHDRDKVAFGIVGVVPMTSVGILAALCRALADAAVPVFVVSTYDTDYLLVSAPRFAAAREALQAQGHRFVGEVPAN